MAIIFIIPVLPYSLYFRPLFLLCFTVTVTFTFTVIVTIQYKTIQRNTIFETIKQNGVKNIVTTTCTKEKKIHKKTTTYLYP